MLGDHEHRIIREDDLKRSAGSIHMHLYRHNADAHLKYRLTIVLVAVDLHLVLVPGKLHYERGTIREVDLNILVEGNPSYSDMLNSRLFPPQTCLKIKDPRSAYSVTLPERSVAYYNCFTVSRTPASVMKDMKGLASLAPKQRKNGTFGTPCRLERVAAALVAQRTIQ